MSGVVEDLGRFLGEATVLADEVGVADLPEELPTFFRTAPLQHVLSGGVEALQGIAGLLTERHGIDPLEDAREVAPTWSEPRNQHVAPIGLGIEVDGRAELPVVTVVEVVVFQEAVDIDAQVGKEGVGLLAECRVVEIEVTASDQARRPTLVELVARGVAAELIVILEDEDSGVLAELLAVEVGGGEAAEASTDDHQSVFLAEVLAGIEVLALERQLVCYLERAGMGAA